MKYFFTLCLALFFSVFVFGASGTTYNPSRSDELDKTKVNFNGQKVMGTVPALSTSNIDMTLSDDCLLTGAKVILVGACEDDEIKFQVLVGSTVVNQFIDWYASDLEKELKYPAKIPTGLTLRVVYKNTCPTTSVKVKINYSLHKVLI
jgi:hypothetical protein